MSKDLSRFGLDWSRFGFDYSRLGINSNLLKFHKIRFGFNYKILDFDSSKHPLDASRFEPSLKFIQLALLEIRSNLIKTHSDFNPVPSNLLQAVSDLTQPLISPSFQLVSYLI